jgi:beta-phosphoglucomutase-like phosphatase (HAD superfamily)
MAPRLHRRPAAVIFDMDGLLLDTEPLAARAWSEAAAALGVEFDDALAIAMIGHNIPDCLAMLRARYGASYPVDALFDRWHATFDAIVARDGVSVKAGAIPLIDWLERSAIPCAIATSTRRERARAKLVDAGLLSRFRDLVGGDEVARGKPQPDIYVEAARRLGVRADACVALEDSVPGVRAALAAQMTAIMVPDLHAPPGDLIALDLLVLPTLHDVLEHLTTLPA